MTKARDLANASTALSAVDATELGYLDGVTSAVQTQLNSKLASSTAATTYVANSLADAKGDLFVATADNTVTRLPVGSTGDTIVADSSTATGLRWGNNYGFTAGKNKLINGDFRINQRSFSSTTNDNTYTFDRWVTYTSGTDQTYTAQTFTAGTAPVAGYEGVNFLQVATTSGATKYGIIVQRIEDVRTFAGQTMTLSFWAKANSGTPKILGSLQQNFGSGGSASVDIAAQAVTISTSWARYSLTFTVPSISGKTVGTSSSFNVSLTFNNAYSGDIGQQTNTFQVWGVQAETGSVATAFQTATGTIQGELAACQRYYYRQTSLNNNYENFGLGMSNGTTTAAVIPINLPATMRTAPTSVDYSTLRLSDFASGNSVTSLTIDGNHNGRWSAVVNAGVASGLTAYRSYALQSNNSTSGYIGFSAEL